MFNDFDMGEDPIVEKQVDWTGEFDLEYCLRMGAVGVDITNEHYHALDGISGSNLALLAESSSHLDNKHLFNLGRTPALTFGSMLHTMVLEPDEVFSRYVVMPNFESKAKTGVSIAEAKESFSIDNSGREIIEQDLFVKAERMAQNVRAICGDVIEKGIKERSLFVDIEGLILKCRLDIDDEEVGDDYDLKSITLGIKDFSNATIEAHIKKFNYHRSAAFRNIIRRKLGKPVRDSYLIFCNTGPGHMVRVIKMAPGWIKETEPEIESLLDHRRDCLFFNKHCMNFTEIDDRNRKINQYQEQ